MGVEPGRRGLASASLVMMAATAVLNLSMVLYHREMSRRLGDAYGDLAAINGVVNVSAIVLSGLAAWLTRTLAFEAALGGGPAALRRLGRLALPLAAGGLAYVALFWLSGALLAPWLRLESPLFAWSALVAAGGILTVVGRSVIQALQRFGLLAFSFVLEGVVRVGAAVVLAVGLGVAGALAGTAVAGILAGACALPLLWAHGRSAGSKADAKGLEAPAGWRSLLWDSAALALFSLICFLDIFVYKNAWGASDPAAVAFYSRGALAGKSFLYIATAFNLVALPAFSAAKARGVATGRLLAAFLLAMLATLGLALLFFWAQTPWILRLVVGDLPGLEALVPLARSLALATVPLALAQLALYYGLAVGLKGLNWALGLAALLYYAALSSWHGQPAQVAVCLGATSAGLLVALLALSLLGSTRGKKEP